MKTENITLSQYGQGNGIYVVHGGKHRSHPTSCNDCYMAAYIAHGNGLLKINNNNVLISENDIFLLRPNITYRFIPEQGLRRIDVYFCYFSFDIIKNAYNSFKEQFSEFANLDNGASSYIHSIDTDNKEIRDICIRMIDEQLSALPCGYDVLIGYLPILIAKILRNAKNRDFKRIYSQDRTVDEAIRYINNHMYAKISLEEIAEHLHISPSFVCRQFKKHTGMTTSQFINFLRVNKIKDILKNTNKPIKAIPEMFNCNIDYLKKVFKRETGMTMLEYRHKYNYKKNPLDKN